MTSKNILKTAKAQKIKYPFHDTHSNDRKPPVFSLYNLQKNYDINDCEKEFKHKVINKLRKLSESTWIELILMPKKSGFEPIPAKKLLVKRPPYISDDIKILSTRMSGGGRILGFRDRDVFHIVWIDPNHKTYKG